MYDASRDIKNLAFFSEWLSDRFDSFMPYDEAKQIVGSIDGALTGLQNLLQTYTGDASKSEHADIIKGAMNLLIEARTKMSLQHENYKHVDMEGVSKNIITSTSRASSPEDQFKAIKYLINCHGVFSQDGGVTQSESLLGSLYNTLKSSNLTPFERECVLSEVILGTMTLQKKIDNVNNEIEVHRQMLKSATTDGQKGKIESEINTLEAKIEVLTVEQGNFNENVALLKSYIEVTEKGGVPTAEQRANILAKVANKFPQNFTANAIKSELSKDGELKEASKSLLSQGYGLVKDNKDAIGDVVLAVLTTGPAGGAAAIAKHTLDKQTLKVFEGLATYIQGPEKQ